MPGTDRWPLAIDGRDYYPIPESWVEMGHDDDEGDRRVYAVSAAVGSRQTFHVRYRHPITPRVIVTEMQGTHSPRADRVVPQMLVSHGTWLRSIIVDDRPPSGVSREPEQSHLREIWAGRVDAIPTDEEVQPVVADGGRARALDALLDVRETHLTEFQSRTGGRY